MDCKMTYRRYATVVQDAGQFFLFSRYYVRFMDREESLFLQDLINHFNIHLRLNQVAEDDFFPCSVAELWSSLRWSEKIQIKWINSLMKKGYLERKMIGMPAVRYLRINMDAVQEKLNQAIADDLDERRQTRPNGRGKPPPGGGGYKEFLQNSKEKRNPDGLRPSVLPLSPQQESTMGFHEDGPPTESKTTKATRLDLQFAKELRSICVSVNRIQPMSPAKWAQDFRKLRELDKRSPQCVQQVLDWYAGAAKTLKAPTIVNAAHFRKHFQWLHDLMARAAKTEIVVEEKVKEVVDNISVFKHPPRGHNWSDVCVFAQTVCNAARDFRKKVWDFLLDPKTKIQRDPKTLQGDDFRMFRMAQELVGYAGIHSAHGYAGWWTDRVLEEVEHWEKWSGNLMSLAWDGDLNNKRFRQSIDQVVKDWGGPRVWDKLKEVLA